jgi:hypothetical protein
MGRLRQRQGVRALAARWDCTIPKTFWRTLEITSGSVPAFWRFRMAIKLEWEVIV